MNSRSNNLLANIDWVSILLYLLLVFIGWLNIYAAVYDENHSSIFDISQKYGKQLVWIGAAFVLAFLVLLTDSKFFTTFSMVIYGIMIFLLIAVLFLGTEQRVPVHGLKSGISAFNRLSLPSLQPIWP